MLEEKRLEELMDTGYKVQQVNVYFTADPNPDINKIPADEIKSWRITMHIKSYNDFFAMTFHLHSLAEEYLYDKLYDSDVQAIRICLVWEKDEEYGKSVEFCECVIHSNFEMEEVSDQIMKLSWLEGEIKC